MAKTKETRKESAPTPIIIGTDCKGCECLSIISKNKVRCSDKDKEFYYGQCVTCDRK